MLGYRPGLFAALARRSGSLHHHCLRLVVFAGRLMSPHDRPVGRSQLLGDRPMIRIASQPKPVTPEWHQVFLEMVPAIETHARLSFGHLCGEPARSDAKRPLHRLFRRRAAGRVEQARSVLPQRDGPVRGRPEPRRPHARPPVELQRHLVNLLPARERRPPSEARQVRPRRE